MSETLSGQESRVVIRSSSDPLLLVLMLAATGRNYFPVAFIWFIRRWSFSTQGRAKCASASEAVMDHESFDISPLDFCRGTDAS